MPQHWRRWQTRKQRDRTTFPWIGCNLDYNRIALSFRNYTDLSPSSGAGHKSHSSGKAQLLLHSTRKATRCSAETTETSRLFYAGKLLFKAVARKRSDCCEVKGLLLEEKSRFRLDRSTTDIMFVVRRLRKIKRKVEVSLFMCFIDLQKASDTVDRTLPWQVLTHIGVPPDIIAVIRQFHSKMRACRRRRLLGLVQGGAMTMARICATPTAVHQILCCRTDHGPRKHSARIRASSPSWYTCNNCRCRWDRSRLWTTYAIRWSMLYADDAFIVP